MSQDSTSPSALAMSSAALPPPPLMTRSPESDVSPKTVVPGSSDYFSARSPPQKRATPYNTSDRAGSPGGSTSTAASIQASSATDLAQSSRRSSGAGDSLSDGPTIDSRKSSAASVTWCSLDPKLPQGQKRPTNAQRLRNSSPTPVKFRRHVGFDNVLVGEATKNNTAAFTLNVRHQGYHPKRRSRTFMVGVDEHVYSDYALKWLLDSLVDDGDEVVCVRVIENPARVGERSYQEDAAKMLHRIQEKNEKNKAISLVLEYSVGKLHSTFQQLIQIYQPSMLIVGTRGRSLGGIQGLVNTRNSFSKYCLQYSPVPVVVVRPDDKRKKKKDKRNNDASRQTYANLLSQNPLGKHEADSENSSVYALENGISADEEAHRVARAIGLPAAFDPTIKPYTPQAHGTTAVNYRQASPSSLTSAVLPERVAEASRRRTSSPPPPTANNETEGEESGDDYEFDVQSVAQLEKQEMERKELERKQRLRLHAMEVGEAAALLKSGASKDIDEEEEEDEP